MIIKQFKNGNLHIKREVDDAGLDGIELLYYNADMHPVSEEYCISNYATASDWEYNGGYDYYRVTSYNLIDLEDFRTAILKRLDDKYVQEYIIPELDY